MDMARLSRRSAFGLAAFTGLSGCTLFRQYSIKDDPYLPTMQTDPLYLWTPSAKSRRSEDYMSSLDHLAANSQSSFTISWSFEDPGVVSAQVEEAQSIARLAGYVDDRRQLKSPDGYSFYVRGLVLSVIERGEVIIDLTAAM